MQQSFLILAILALSFLSVFMLFLAIAKPKQREDVESRLKRLTTDAEPTLKLAEPSPDTDDSPKQFSAIDNLNAQLDELFKPLVAGRLSEHDERALKSAAENAGRYGTTAQQIRIWQFKMAFSLPFATLIFSLGLIGFNAAVTPLLLIGAAVGGYYYPVLALSREATSRRNAILRQLPTTLDLLTICVEAGLSLQAALFKVVEKTRSSPLRDEIDQVLREIQLGRPRAESLKDMARRINLKEVNSVVLAMVQAEAMGTSIAKTLRIQSEIAREGRWLRAQEQAFQAPVKLSFPLVFFIFPVIFIVIFGPVGLELFTNWTSPTAPAPSASTEP